MFCGLYRLSLSNPINEEEKVTNCYYVLCKKGGQFFIRDNDFKTVKNRLHTGSKYFHIICSTKDQLRIHKDFPQDIKHKPN